jgi:hypothetical protein
LKLQEKFQRMRMELLQNGWILLQDDTGSAFCGKEAEEEGKKKVVSVLNSAPYLLDLTPHDVFLFPKLN